MSGEKILVVGAAGYVGSRLVPFLLSQGYFVRAAGRTRQGLESRCWSGHERIELCVVDVFDRANLKEAAQGCRAAYYLVHSMNSRNKNFVQADRLAAENMAWASRTSDLERIIFLGGLGDEKKFLSRHLRSRAEVGRILQEGTVPVTILRAAMIIGTGSASFEIFLRYLVERLPLILTPPGVTTVCQPIAIRNVLYYLVGCLEGRQTQGQVFDVGWLEAFSYRELMDIFAEEAGIKKRFIVSVPGLTPALCGQGIRWMTPVPASLAQPLAEGLGVSVVCQDLRIRTLIRQEIFGCRQAMRLALHREQKSLPPGFVEQKFLPPELRQPGDPSWVHG